MAVVEIALAGDPVLRKKAAIIPQEKITSDDTQNLIQNLIDTVSEEPEEGFVNVGLAAPQISVSKRVFVVIKSKKGDDIDYQVYINPEIEFISQQLVTSEESCLSTPHLCGEVQRYRKIRIKYFDHEGKKQSEKIRGDRAIYLQHELDHLDGILWFDKVKDTKTISYC
jgi:peptide deformylase